MEIMEIDIRNQQPLLSTWCCKLSVREQSRNDKINRILACLMDDARISLAEISRRTGIPTSTVFDYMKIIRRRLTFVPVPAQVDTHTNVGAICSDSGCSGVTA